MGVAQSSSIHQSDLILAPGCNFMTSARRSQTRINNTRPPYTRTTERMYLVSLGVTVNLGDGSPKNQVLGKSSLKGELVNEHPARMNDIATKPSTAGCQRNRQPSKGPGVNRPSGV